MWKLTSSGNNPTGLFFRIHITSLLICIVQLPTIHEMKTGIVCAIGEINAILLGKVTIADFLLIFKKMHRQVLHEIVFKKKKTLLFYSFVLF